MELVTKSLLAKTPRLLETAEIEDPVAQFKLFAGPWTWFVIEIDEAGRRAHCFVCDARALENAEAGDVDLDELRALRLPLGLGVERDRYWDARPLSQCKKELGLA